MGVTVAALRRPRLAGGLADGLAARRTPPSPTKKNAQVGMGRG